MNNRLYLKSFFERHVNENRRYHFTVNHSKHWMDSRFIINEMLNSSQDEQEDIKNFLEEIKMDEDSIHQFLNHLAIIYAMGNQKG